MTKTPPECDSRQTRCCDVNVLRLWDKANWMSTVWNRRGAFGKSTEKLPREPNRKPCEPRAAREKHGVNGPPWHVRSKARKTISFIWTITYNSWEDLKFVACFYCFRDKIGSPASPQESATEPIPFNIIDIIRLNCTDTKIFRKRYNKVIIIFNKIMFTKLKYTTDILINTKLTYACYYVLILTFIYLNFICIKFIILKLYPFKLNYGNFFFFLTTWMIQEKSIIFKIFPNQTKFKSIVYIDVLCKLNMYFEK